MNEPLLRKARRVGKTLNALALVAPRTAGRLAFEIFCTPRNGRLRDSDREFLASAEQATQHLAGHSIQTYRWPAKYGGQPLRVLFLHGWESNSARWRSFIHAFRHAGVEVSAFDAPGHGSSSGKRLNVLIFSRVLKDFLEKNGPPDVIIGHSLGGAAIVMSIAAFGAERPKRAVVLGTFAESSRVISDFAELLGLSEKVRAEVAREVERRVGMTIAEFSIKEKARLLGDLPGLVLHDREDAIAPFAEGEAVAETWGAKFLGTTGLGHRMQDKSVVAAVLEFAAGV